MNMTKKTLILFLTIILMPCILADIIINSSSTAGVYIYELEKPAVIDLQITSTQETGTYEIYNLLGFKIEPNKIELKNSETKNIVVEITPPSDFNYEGIYILPIFVGKNNVKFQDELLLKATHLENAFEIGIDELNPESDSVELYVLNKENYDFGKVKFTFDSAFFDTENSFDMGPKEKKFFTIDLDREKFKELTAGYYTIKTKIEVGDVIVEKDSTIKFEEKDLLEESSETYGFLLTTEVIKKSNKGNTVIPSEIIVEKNIVSRLFTSFNNEPDLVERDGGKITYTWRRDIKPGEDLEIKIRTNWLFPFLVVLLVISIVVFAKKYFKHDVSLRKKITFMKAKGGEFALKVTIHVHARKYVEKITLTDRLPPLVKLYEQFGHEKPSRVDLPNKRIIWDFEKLEAGETRVLNYIIYSKVGVMGKFALPSAEAIYEREGKIKESSSNKAFFITEQKREIE